jgi:hypothetical protein
MAESWLTPLPLSRQDVTWLVQSSVAWVLAAVLTVGLAVGTPDPPPQEKHRRAVWLLLIAILMVLGTCMAQPVLKEKLPPELVDYLAQTEGPLAFGLIVVRALTGTAAAVYTIKAYQAGKKD